MCDHVFGTAHGVFAHDGHIFVANREAHQVPEFTPEGSLVRAMPDLRGVHAEALAQLLQHSCLDCERLRRVWSELERDAGAVGPPPS